MSSSTLEGSAWLRQQRCSWHPSSPTHSSIPSNCQRRRSHSLRHTTQGWVQRSAAPQHIGWERWRERPTTPRRWWRVSTFRWPWRQKRAPACSLHFQRAIEKHLHTVW